MKLDRDFLAARNQRIRQDAMSGVTSRDLALRYGLSVVSVNRIIRDLDIPAAPEPEAEPEATPLSDWERGREDGRRVVLSDPGRYDIGRSANDLSSKSPLDVVRPQTADTGGLRISGGSSMPQARPFNGVGRPTTAETKARTHDFIRRIASGEDFDRAALAARVQPVRALAILSKPEVRQIIKEQAA